MSGFSTRRIARHAARPWLAWAVCTLVPALGAGAAERGLPLLTVFPSEVHKAGPQTFDLAQDSRGILYFGNLHGLVTYDGAWWRLRKLPKDQAVLSVAADTHGTVALGLVNDFGYLAHDAGGVEEYRTLLPLLPEEARQFGNVTGVCSTTAGFLFTTEKRVVLWNGKTARLLEEVDPESAARGCFADSGGIYLRGPKGLRTFDPVTMRTAPAGLEGKVGLVLRAADGKVIASVRDRGLFIVERQPQPRAIPFAPEASKWLKGKIVTGGCRLPDGRIVVTTRQNGLAILAANGDLEHIIDQEAGLPDAVLNGARVDREGSLWLAMDGPIVRIDLASPVTVFDTRRGLRGGVSDVASHADHLHVATSHGLYIIGHDGRAARVDSIEDPPWRMLRFDDELLVGTTKGIYRIDASEKVDHPIQREAEIYDLFRSPSDPSRVWLAESAGISSIRRQDGRWKDEGLLPELPKYASTVVERDGVLWCGTVFNGILRIDDPRGPSQKVTQFGEGEMNVYNIGGRVILVRATGRIVEVDGGGRLAPDSILGHVTAPRGFFVVAEDPSGDIWINSTPPRVFERQPDGKFGGEGRPLVSVTAADIQNLRATPDGVVWFAADKGLFRYEQRTADRPTASQPTPLIRRVVAGESRILFGGAAAQGEPVSLRHNFGRVRIEFAPASYRPGASYQYRLDPIDNQWSEWMSEPFIDYTTLNPNRYTFRLRARGPGTAPSPETRWSFTVRPPWYRTPWAYALWVILFVAAVVGVIRVRTSTLHRQAEKLRATVAVRTEELRNTVRLLEEANLRLEALSLEDDLTGIANRRSFERALVDEWNRARRYSTSLALILIDLDHFKDLNDHRGHPAGDDCLRLVGAFLADTIRRSGEVVARYGGEEFAILLPGVDDDAAICVAEGLREGIEQLGIPYTDDKTRRVSASCGVASLVPTADLMPDSLVANADRALYAAKHSGRNCVRVADETSTGTWLKGAST
jgi:diguanylate cyclase (GGDEF)-like protein